MTPKGNIFSYRILCPLMQCYKNCRRCPRFLKNNMCCVYSQCLAFGLNLWWSGYLSLSLSANCWLKYFLHFLLDWGATWARSSSPVNCGWQVSLALSQALPPLHYQYSIVVAIELHHLYCSAVALILSDASFLNNQGWEFAHRFSEQIAR